ncbi:MAG: hypothetical protein HY606_03895 [Planctomycetes bacterium]|nr:hypothetical protein [Planctomycetota bacterium]
MVKANVITKDGVKISIEGTPKEVADLLAQLKGNKLHFVTDKQQKEGRQGISDKARQSPINLILDLIDGGFFNKPRELSAIKNALSEQGYYCPITSLSTTVLRLVRKSQLHRTKDKKRWLYIQ